MQKAKERPNLVHWRDELVAITKDSSEDFEDATLSVELMRVRCDVCYHEKSVSLVIVSFMGETVTHDSTDLHFVSEPQGMYERQRL